MSYEYDERTATPEDMALYYGDLNEHPKWTLDLWFLADTEGDTIQDYWKWVRSQLDTSGVE